MTAQVLLVEDETPVASVLSRALTAHGWSVEAVDSGAGALAAIAEGRPDVILLDVNLPDITGWEVLRRLSPERRDTTPVIVYSAAVPAANRIAEFQPAGVLTKPFPVDSLLRLVAAATSDTNTRRAADVVGVATATCTQASAGGEIVVVGRELRWVMRAVAQAEHAAHFVTALHRSDPIDAALNALARVPDAIVVAVPAGTTLDTLRPLLDPTVVTRRLLVLAEDPPAGLRELVGLCGGALSDAQEPPILLTATLIAMLAPPAA